MFVPQPPQPAVAGITAIRGLRWCVDGLALWRRAPFKLFFLCLTTLVIEILIQRIPWVGSWTLSVIVFPLLTYGILLGLDELVRAGRLRWSCLWAAFHHRRFPAVLVLAAICGLCTTGIMQFAAWLVYGWPAVDMVWLGHRAAHFAMITSGFERVLQLPGLVPVVFLLLAPCLLLFEGTSPIQAVLTSVKVTLQFAGAFGAFLGVLACLYLIMTATMRPVPWTWILMLVLQPWIVACSYAIWRSLRHGIPQSAAPSSTADPAGA